MSRRRIGCPACGPDRPPSERFGPGCEQCEGAGWVIEIRDPEPPAGWVIDVCATCGRLAVYPFACGHRSSVERWTVGVAVKPTAAGLSTLRRAMETAARRQP